MTTTSTELVQIGELAIRLGITTRTIRYYEEIGLMGPSERLGGGARPYSRNDILRLKFILKMKDLGLSLKEMQELSRNFDTHNQDFSTITPQLLEMPDLHINKVDEKISRLASLRKDIVDYRARIQGILMEQSAGKTT
ncbi:MAG: MerR family transcriptional regulator [Desulfuromonadales bacterium]|nr:MerR family transcriptional regulator [Desulfuromonadales bacterium]